MNIEIGKAQITPQIAEILSELQVSDNERLQRHLETLGNIQDYLCTVINDELVLDIRDDLGEYMRNLVHLKNDLKKLVIKQ